MKKIILCLGFLFTLASAFSQSNDPRCPVFRRSNGNSGSCDARITLFYPTCPSTDYYVIGILNNGTLIPGLSFTTGACRNGKVEVCIAGSNLPPTQNLSLLFSNTQGGNLLFACSDIPNGGPLPVTMSEFVATRKSPSQVSLSWKTTLELNVREFIIQRKTGSTFEDIATVSAKNQLQGDTYSYSDMSAGRSAGQYRLKIMDVDGNFELSDIKNIRAMNGSVVFSAFPNPAYENVTIELAGNNDPYTIEVLDNSGRTIRNLNVSGNSKTVVSQLPKGAHMIRVTNKLTGEKETKMITVL